VAEYGQPNFHFVPPGILPRGPVGDVETRIRNQLEQEGPLPTSIDYAVQPTMAVADGMSPGNSKTRNRGFVFSGVGIASGQCHGIRAIPTERFGVIIDAVYLSINGSASAGNADIVQLALFDPGNAGAPVVPVGGAVPWIDAPDGSLAPCWIASAAAATGNIFQTVNLPNLGPPAKIDLKMYLSPGSIFVLRFAAAGLGSFTFSVHGRTF